MHSKWYQEITGFLRSFLQKIAMCVKLFIRNELPNHAGAAAFYFLLSVPPVIMLFLFFFSPYLSTHPSFTNNVVDLLQRLHPSLNEQTLGQLGLMNIGGTVVGVFSLLNLVWAARLVSLGIIRGLGVIFPSQKARSPLMQNVIAFAALSLLLILIVIVVFLSLGIQLFQGMTEDSRFARSFFQVISRILPGATAFLVIFLTYRFIPPKRPRTFSAIKGSLFCTAGISLIQFLFSRFISVARFNLIYGLLGSLILLLVGMHFTFILYFFFAEFTHVADNYEVLMLSRMYRLRRRTKTGKIEQMLFQLPERLFKKYTREYQEGDILFQEGDENPTIFFVYQGEVGIYLESGEKSTRISTIREKEIFGEMAYLLSEKRTATARADTKSVLFVLSPSMFESLIQVDPQMSRDVIQLLSDRLRKSHAYMTP